MTFSDKAIDAALRAWYYKPPDTFPPFLHKNMRAAIAAALRVQAEETGPNPLDALLKDALLALDAVARQSSPVCFCGHECDFCDCGGEAVRVVLRTARAAGFDPLGVDVVLAHDRD